MLKKKRKLRGQYKKALENREMKLAGDFPKATVEKIKSFLTVAEHKINQHFQGKAMPVVISMASRKNGN